MKDPEKPRSGKPTRKRALEVHLDPQDAATIHRDRVRLLGAMAKLLDLGDEDEVRAVLSDLGQPEGSRDHERIVSYWRSLLGESQARRKPQR